MANGDFYSRLGQVIAQSYTSGQEQARQRQQQQQKSAYWNALTKYIQRGGTPLGLEDTVGGDQETFEQYGIPEEERAFYNILPKVVSTKGVRQVTKEPRRKSASEIKEIIVSQAVSGQRTWESVKKLYPLDKKIEEARVSNLPKAVRAAGFQFGGGLDALRSPLIARQTPNASYFIGQIDNEEDLQEFIETAPTRIGQTIKGTKEEFTQNDINTVLEYYGKRNAN